MLANLELQQTTSLPCSLDWKWSLSYSDFCCCHVECSKFVNMKDSKNAYGPKSCKVLKNKCLNLYMLHGFEIATHGNEMTSNIEIDNLN